MFTIYFSRKPACISGTQYEMSRVLSQPVSFVYGNSFNFHNCPLTATRRRHWDTASISADTCAHLFAFNDSIV